MNTVTSVPHGKSFDDGSSSLNVTGVRDEFVKELGRIHSQPKFDSSEVTAIYDKMIYRVYAEFIFGFETDCVTIIHVALNRFLEDVLVKIYSSVKHRQFQKQSYVQNEDPIPESMHLNYQENETKRKTFTIKDLHSSLKMDSDLFPNRRFYLAFVERIESKLSEKIKKEGMRKYGPWAFL